MIKVKRLLGAKTQVIWDWNGTLLDDVDLCVEVISSMLIRAELPPLDHEGYRRTFRFPIREYYRELGFDVAMPSFLELSRQFIGAYNLRVKNCALHVGARALLSDLKESGVACHVLSAAHEGDLTDQLRHHDIHDYFDNIFGISDHFAAGKIERGHQLLSLLGARGVSPRDVVLIGDTNHDAEVAAALGIDAILLGDGHQHPDLLVPLRHPVILRGEA